MDKNKNLEALYPIFEEYIENMFKWDDEIGEKVIFNRRTYDPMNRTMDKILSLTTLQDIRNTCGDLETGRSLAGNDNRFCFKRSQNRTLAKVKNKLTEITGKYWMDSGFFWYPPNGYCGWHTNSNSLGPRIYFAWADEDNESFFRYYNSDTGEIITEWDKKGMNVHQFEVSLEKPCWHCVGSYSNRVSVGFKVDKYGKEVHVQQTA